MFIRWRTYQRQNNHVKYDRYILQPILVKSYRAKKGDVWKMVKGRISREDFEDLWTSKREYFSRSRHKILYRFLNFAACDYVYYDNPNHIESRLRYWEYLDYLLTEGALSELDKATKNKIVDEIESLLPRPHGDLLNILERAYEAGMPEAPSPVAHLRK